MLRIFTSILCLWTLAACASTETASTEPAGGSDCFRSELVSGYTVIDANHIGIRVGANRDYVLTTMWNARDLDWTHAIGIRSSTGRICTGNGLGVELLGGDPQRTYPVSSIARVPDTEPVQGS